MDYINEKLNQLKSNLVAFVTDQVKRSDQFSEKVRDLDHMARVVRALVLSVLVILLYLLLQN